MLDTAKQFVAPSHRGVPAPALSTKRNLSINLVKGMKGSILSTVAPLPRWLITTSIILAHLHTRCSTFLLRLPYGRSPLGQMTRASALNLRKQLSDSSILAGRQVLHSYW